MTVLLSESTSGLGKQSQGISTALAVEKTSKRGGKIVNIAAETGIKLSSLHSNIVLLSMLLEVLVVMPKLYYCSHLMISMCFTFNTQIY